MTRSDTCSIHIPRDSTYKYPINTLINEANLFYNSKEYQEAWSLAKSSTDRNLQIIEGV